MKGKKVIIKGTNAGFFSMFRGTVGTIYAAKAEGYDVFVDWSNTLYNDDSHGPNVWEYFFENLSDSSIGGQPTSHVILPREASTRQFMHQTITDHIKVKQDILKEVESLVGTHPNLLGVHIRLTDKHNCTQHGEPETGKPIDIDLYVKHVDSYLEKYPTSKIYLATDDEKCMSCFKELYGDKLIYKDAIRSSGSVSIHHHLQGSNYQKGRDVLVDCLALSKCNHLIKGISNVALNALFFNKDLTSENLNSIYNKDNREDFV
jgi:hypothetical protein